MKEVIKKLYLIFYTFGKQLQRDNISAYASSTAFFFFLSIVPILLIVCSVITFTPITEEMMVGFISRVIPSSLSAISVTFVEQTYDTAHTILPIAIVVALWSAGKGMMGLQMGLNVAHGVVESRNFVLVRLQASFYTLVTLVAILSTFLFSMFTKSFASHFIKLNIGLDWFAFISHYRFIFGWALLTVIFTLIYKFIPNKKLKLIYQIPGAMFAAIGWQVYSWGFSIYIENFGGMSTYGSLSTIIIIMMWLYFSMYLLLIGANLNRYFKPVIKVLFRRK